MIKKAALKAKVMETLILACCFPFAVATADNSAVTETNYEAGINYDTSHYFDDYSINGRASFPISDYLGTSLSAGFMQSNGKNSGSSITFDSEHYFLNALVFLRDQSMGRLGLGYTYSHSKYDYPDYLFGSDELDAHGYIIFGEYYLGNITLLAERDKYTDSDDYNIFSSTLMAAWYLQDNFKISISRSMFEDQYNTGMYAEYQPSFMNNAMSITLNYQKDSEDSDYDSYGITLSYFFGTRVNLIERDRKYR